MAIPSPVACTSAACAMPWAYGNTTHHAPVLFPYHSGKDGCAEAAEDFHSRCGRQGWMVLWRCQGVRDAWHKRNGVARGSLHSLVYPSTDAMYIQVQTCKNGIENGNGEMGKWRMEKWENGRIKGICLVGQKKSNLQSVPAHLASMPVIVVVVVFSLAPPPPYGSKKALPSSNHRLLQTSEALTSASGASSSNILFCHPPSLIITHPILSHRVQPTSQESTH